VPIYEKQTVIDIDPPTLFAWHARPGAFERLSPPWQHLRVLSRHGGIADGARVTLVLKHGPFSVRWEALHRGFVDGVQFQDVQVSGPFKRWEHTHRVEATGDGRAMLVDRVDYALPLGPLGNLAAQVFGGRQMDRLFAFRHRRIATDLARHKAMGRGRRLRLVLTGRAGFVLTQLAAFLSTGGHLVHVFPTSEDVRVGPTQAAWGPKAVPDFVALEQADAVLNVGLHGLPQLLRTLDERGSRARTVVAVPTVAAAQQPDCSAAELSAVVQGSPRRLVALLTPGVLAAWPSLEGLVPVESITGSVDGALTSVDDLIGAAYYAVTDDSLRGMFDVSLPRAGETAAVPGAVARFVPEVRTLQLRVPEDAATRPLTSAGFTPLSPTLADAILAELGWPPVKGRGTKEEGRRSGGEKRRHKARNSSR
jgi:ligand-binding SRPBCC domain-containing protein